MLFETAAGFAVFKVTPVLVLITLELYNSEQLLDEKKLQQVDDLYQEFESPERASKM